MRFPFVHPAARITIVIGVALVALCAFLAVRAEDAVFPVGTKSMIFVSETTLDDGEFADAITSVAISHKANLLKLTNQPNGDTIDRVLYVVEGDPERVAHVDGGSYPDFDRNVTTDVRPFAELAGLDPRGYYATDITESEAHVIVSALRAESITAAVERRSTPDGLALIIEQFPLIPILLSLGLSIIAVTGYTHAAHTKHRAVLQVNGVPRARTLLTTVVQTVLFLLVAGVTATSLSLGALTIYNGSNQALRYVGALWLGLLALGGCFCACQLAYSYFSADPSISRAIRGARHLRGIAVTSVVVALIALFASALAAARAPDELDARQQLNDAAHAWASQNQRIALRYGGALTNDDFESVTASVAQLYRELEGQGRASLAVPGWPSPEGAPDFHPESGNTIIASPHFLSRVDVLDARGRPLREGSIDAAVVTLLIPSSAKSHRAQIVRSFEEFLDFQASVDSGDESTETTTRIETRFTKAGQDVFNLQPGAGPSFQRDPVIAIIGAASRALSDNYYMAATSSQHATFDVGTDIPGQLAARDLSRYIPSSYELRAHVLSRLGDQSLTLDLGRAASALQFTAAGLSVILLAVTLAFARRRASFLRRINGVNWVERNLAFLALMAALVTFVVVAVLILEEVTLVQGAWVGASLLTITVIALAAYVICERGFSVRAAKE